jgi:hypothetical protein
MNGVAHGLQPGCRKDFSEQSERLRAEQHCAHFGSHAPRRGERLTAIGEKFRATGCGNSVPVDMDLRLHASKILDS